MESIYLLRLKTPNSGTIHFLLKYNEHDDLMEVQIRDIDSKLIEKQRNWIWNFVPKTTTELAAKTAKEIKITKIESELSFDAFWDLYNYKLGNKKRAKAHWDKLTETKKALVMQKVKEYNFYMLHKSHDKVFAERFLSEKRYENDFTVKS